MTYVEYTTGAGPYKRASILNEEELPPPMPSQIEDIELMVKNKHWGLFNEPGTGKTLTALWAWGTIRAHAPTLCIVVPNIAVSNWIRWTGTAFPKVNIQLISSGKTRIKADTDVIIITYGLISSSNSMYKNIIMWAPHCVILDECDNLTGNDALRTIRIYGPTQGKIGGICEKSPYVWGLTGTPVLKYYDDLYPFFRSLFPDVLYDYGVEKFYAYKHHFCYVDKIKMPNRRIVEKVSGSKNHKLFDQLKAECSSTRLLSEVEKHMPELRHVPVSFDINMSPEFEELLIKLEEVRYDEIDPTIKEMNPYITRAWHQLGVEKAPYIADHAIMRRKTIGPVLIFYWHTDVRDLIHADLISKGLYGAYISGSTSSKSDENTVKRFNDGQLDYVLGQIRAMGVSLNMQRGGRYALFAERSWSPRANEQAYKRLWRKGQERKVLVEDAIAANNPVEAMISSTHNRKNQSVRREQ